MRVLVSGLLVLAAAGCGEDTIPLAEYVERANAICADNNTRGRAELQKVRDRLEADGELDEQELPELNRKALGSSVQGSTASPISRHPTRSRTSPRPTSAPAGTRTTRSPT